MKVEIRVMNKGTNSQYHIIWDIESEQVMYAPNNWKTYKGAYNWCMRNDFEVIK